MRTYTFPAIIEKEAVYGAFFPDLPGCGTVAETMEGLAEMAREALEFHLSGMVEDGEPIPQPSTFESLPHDPEVRQVGVMLVSAAPHAKGQVTIAVSKATLEKVDAAAAEQGLTRERVIVDALEADFEISATPHAA